MVKVEVSIRGSAGEKFLLNVKEGKQSFKWLAQVVQSRLGVEAVCKLVTTIENAADELINPRDCIADHVDKDGLCKCFATVVTSFPSDVWGNPVYGDWMSAAHLRSEPGRQWASDMAQWRERLALGLIDASGRMADTSALVLTGVAESKSGVEGGAASLGSSSSASSASSSSSSSSSSASSSSSSSSSARREVSGGRAEAKGGELAEDGAAPRRKSRTAPGPVLTLNREAAGEGGVDKGRERGAKEERGDKERQSAEGGEEEEELKDGSTRLRHK